jgi:hypothetical protein
MPSMNIYGGPSEICQGLFDAPSIKVKEQTNESNSF